MQTLKEIRESKGIKQDAVADHLGVTRQTYASYGAGARKDERRTGQGGLCFHRLFH